MRLSSGSAVALAITTLACGGSEFTTGSDTDGLGGMAGAGASSNGGSSNGGSSNGGSSNGGSSNGGSSNGGSSNGGSSTGGSPSGGSSTGGTSTGGVGMGGAGGIGECRTDFDCPQPGAPCSSVSCVQGTCVFSAFACGGAGGGTSCTDAYECPPPPPYCLGCPNGGEVCPYADCIAGQCTIVEPACPPPPPQGCPANVPLLGATCTPPPGSVGVGEVAHCSWGDDPRIECRTTALCGNIGMWEVTGPAPGACDVEPLPATCPLSLPSGQCSTDQPACWYPDGTRCACSDCLNGSQYPSCQLISPPQWACHSPPPGCPDLTPQAGQPCTEQGLSCGPDCEHPIICDEGAWRWRAASCPICAAPDTPIATPDGPRPIAELREGDLVYSVHGGAVVPVPIARTGSTPVQNHRVMRVQLESGAVLEISPGHPTADGRTFGELRAGDLLDEQHGVRSSALVPFTHDRTYDILPASDTGTYFAAGALIGSTLVDRAETMTRAEPQIAITR